MGGCYAGKTSSSFVGGGVLRVRNRAIIRFSLYKGISDLYKKEILVVDPKESFSDNAHTN